MKKPIVFEAGELKGAFFVETNAKKSVEEFCEHEKHTGFTKAQLKEIHGLIKKADTEAEVKPAKESKPEKEVKAVDTQ